MHLSKGAARLQEVQIKDEYARITYTDPASLDLAELVSMNKWMNMIGQILIYLTAIFLLFTVVAQLYIWFHR